MLTLAFDTTANSVSVALLQGETVVAQNEQVMERGQGEALIPMIQELMKNAGYQMSSVEQIAVSVGPGSFTGVRVGLSAARGMGLALSVPVIGVSMLTAAAFRTTGQVVAVIDTKRGDFYTQTFSDGDPLEKPCIRTAEQIEALSDFKVLGSGASLVRKSHLDNKLMPAVAVGLCALSSPLPPEPLYLREADVSC